MIFRWWMISVATLCAAAVVYQHSRQPRLATAITAIEIGEPMPIVQPDMWAIMTIVGEAASEPLEGQVAVGNVIRNRMRRKYSSDGTVIGTVLRLRQFSCWDDKARLYAANIDIDDPEFSRAAEAWMRSSHTTVVGDAVLYHTRAVNPVWNRHHRVRKVKIIGAHIFYDETRG